MGTFDRQEQHEKYLELNVLRDPRAPANELTGLVSAN
jgi:hypothetical protein